MSKKGNLKVIRRISIILSIILFILLLFSNYNYIKDYIYNINKIDTVISTRIDTVYKIDTFNIIKPIPKYIEKIKTDTFYTKEGKDTILNFENKLYQDTLICNKDTAEVQIFISGIKSNVDSMNLNLRKSETIITNTEIITKYIEKKRTFWNRLSIGPAVTAGYDPLHKQFATTIGFGVFLDIK